MVNSVVVNSKQLGSGCWLPGRFCPGARCRRVYDCNYPEKATCTAVQAERDHLEQVRASAEKQYIEKLNALNRMVEGARAKLDRQLQVTRE